MVIYSGWLIALILLGITVIILFSSVVAHFYEYIPVYRSSRIFVLFLTVIFVIGEIILWTRVHETLTGRLDLRWPNLTAIFLVICWSILVGFFTFCVYKYGKNWWFRQQFVRRQFYGPWLVFTESPENSIIICFYSIKSTRLENQLENSKPKLSNAPDFQEEVLATDITYLTFKNTENPIKGLFRYKIENLKPKTKYFYRIPGSSQTYSFVTAPPPEIENNSDSPKEINFLITGDLHGGSGNNSKMYSLIEKTIKSQQIDFILNTGDLLSDSSILSQYKTLFAQSEKILAETLMIHTTGNHDGYRKKGARIWRTHFPQPFPDPLDGAYSTFKFGYLAIVCIDFYNSGHLFEQISTKQKEWIDFTLKQLSEDKNVTAVFFTIHHPIASTGDCGINNHLLAYFDSLFETYHKIRGVFSGHTHFFQLFEYKKRTGKENTPIPLLITAGAGLELERSSLKKWYPRPYLWLKSEITDAKCFVGKKYRKDLQNDEFIKNYHTYTKIIHHFTKISINEKEITIEAVDRNGIRFFRKEVT